MSEFVVLLSPTSIEGVPDIVAEREEVLEQRALLDG